MLAEQNRGLAVKVARAMASESPESPEDLEQIAAIGLLRAVERYNPECGTAFSSFAVPHIRGEIQHWQRDHYGASPKVPRRAFEESGRVRRTVARAATQGRDLEPDRVAAAYGLSAERWSWIAEAVKRPPIANLDELQVAAADDDELDDERRGAYERLHSAIARFPEFKRRCVYEFWFKGRTVAAIARQLKRPIAAVQGQLDEALAELKQLFIQVS